jgi:hypothetical protein
MKKLFTLMAFVLLAGSAFGQQKWKNIVVNGDMEGNVVAYDSYDGMPADAWNSFWVHEWPKGEEGESQYQGTATVVDGLGVDGSHCAKVVARSDEQAIAAGNRTEANGALASWDCQFFIYGTEPMLEGKEVRLTMYVKADKDGSIETQAHYGPGNYNHYQLFGNISVTTEWKKVVTDVVTVSADQSKEADGKYFQSVAFNLSTDKEGNVFYFDNIKLEVKDPKQDDDGAVEWINFMRKGIYSNDHITGVNSSGEPWECTNFTVQDLNKPDGEQQQPAPVVEVPGEPGVFAVQVPVRGYKVQEVEDLDEEGNQQFDDDGNVKMKNVYYWNDGVEIGTSAPARWTCQFFVSTLHKMKSGERYKFRFSVKADRETALGTQAHYGPGQYKDYNTFGSETDFPITTEWSTFDLGEAQGKKVPSGANGCQTITFDCVPLESEDNNNFYFIFEECSFTEANVLDADRTLGTPETIGLKVNSDDNEMATTIDASGMLNTFEVTDFSFLKNPKSGDGVKLFALVEDPESDDPMEGFSGMLNWSDGGFIGKDGYFIDDSDQGISIRLDDESIDGTNINFMVWNNPDAGISFANGETVNTKLAICQSGWYYVYNVILSADGTGIREVKMNKNNGKIYDLMGRIVENPTKGLYIQNGKKFIVK